LQRAEADHARFGAALGRGRHCVAKQVIGAREARIGFIQMPAGRNGPGARSILRASGCGSCGLRVRFVTNAISTNTRPFSTFTA
jgi:hypothetical protein